MSFVCDPCKHQHHTECNGGTWCDCQHRTTNQEKKK